MSTTNKVKNEGIEESSSDSDVESEYDSNSESDSENNNVTEELCGTTPEFCNNINKLKYKIYENIILSPTNEDSDEAQDPALMQKYINALDVVYKSAIDNVTTNNSNIADKSTLNKAGYSDESVNDINNTIKHMNEYVTNNSSLNKIAYLSYITNQFRIFPFIQLPYFPE
jgi:hypothetical protein